MDITKHVEKIKIYNHYTNYKGRLFVKTLCDLFNDVAETQTKMIGVDVATLNAQGFTWMLHRLHIQLNKMPAQDEEVFIETWPSGNDRLLTWRDYRVVRENGEELIRATSEWMYIDLNRRRPLRLPEKIIQMSSEHNIPHLILEPILNEKEFQWQDSLSGRTFAATYDNIDFNGHVTQAAYMRWITNSLPFDFLKDHILLEVEVIYSHEILPDQTVYSGYRLEENGEQIVIEHQLSGEDGRIKHCIAKTIWEKA
jgi:acyl-ACP thioesterase